MAFSFIGYTLLLNNITSNHEKDVEIIVLNVKNKTNRLLSRLLHEYTIQHDILITKHKEVTRYLTSKSYYTNLDDIKKHINIGHKNNPYNIYVTDETLVIKNTTYKPDIGFNLSFAKKIFDEHYKKGIIGCNTPVFEPLSKNFFSYTDSYFSKNGNKKAGILQISYNYIDSKQDFLNLQKQMALYKEITELKAYILANDGFINELVLKDYPAYKPDSKKMDSLLKDGTEVSEKLKNINLIENTFTKDGHNFRAIFISTKSAILDDVKIIYSLLINESEYINDVKNLKIWMFIITFLGIVAIYIINKIKEKEARLDEQDMFVQSSMHEIKTPLSIITLNNELRSLEFGKDEYSVEIDSALKLLKTSYDDMSFTITRNKLVYPIDIINLNEVLKDRVEYFKTIAQSSSKNINLSLDSDCQVKMSLVELIRLIDNNLSNAIKYSSNNTNIDVLLKKNILSFHNMGKPIHNKESIFNKYFRENTVVGGHGLGLSIVKEISKKYSIDITVKSYKDSGTTFIYKFKCHTNDI